MPQGSHEPPTRIPRLGWAIAFLVATTVIAWAYMQFNESLGSRTFSAPLPKHAPAPEFQLTAQDGSTVTTADLKGKVWVANFIFTRCGGPCPVMTSRMAEINQALGNRAPEVELISITVDPAYDTPEVLREYAEQAGADPAKWKFLTGPIETVETTIREGFLQSLTKEPSGAPLHSTRFVLVDREGWMRGFRDGNDPEIVQKVLMDIGDVLREPSGTQPK
jgi:protein SCO1